MTSMLPRRSSAYRSAEQPAPVGFFAPVAQLSALATELAELQLLGPRAAFREELRSRLLAEAARGRPQNHLAPGADAHTGTARPARADRHRHARRAAAAGLAVALAGGGVAAAASRSLPGDPLYPLKRVEQSIRLGLDPTPGAGPAIRLVSARISDAERTAGADPGGTRPELWSALDASLAEADQALVGLTATAPPTELSRALAPERERVQHLLTTVPESQQPVIQQLLDTIDGLSPTVPGTAAASGWSVLDLLPSRGLSSTTALAQGWPLDPAALAGALPASSSGANPALPGGSTALGANVASATGSLTAPGSGVSGQHRSEGAGAGGTGSGNAAGPGSARPGSGPSMRTGSPGPTTVLPRVTGAVGGLVGGTPGSATGANRAGGPTPTARASVGTINDAVNDSVEDAADLFRRLTQLGPVPAP